MPGDAAATRKRILDAAVLEFSEHGIAGGRVDRIAANAKANKQLIYAYFGDKEQLFLTVLDAALQEAAERPKFDRHNLPEFVAGYFDFLESHPHYGRLILWEKLERRSFPSQQENYQRLIDEVARGQEEAIVTRDFQPDDLVALLAAVAGAWHNSAPALKAVAGESALQQHREAIIRATVLLLSAGINTE